MNTSRTDVSSSELISRKKIYEELLQLLCRAELAARNGEWMTCGTWAKKVMNRAYEIGNSDEQLTIPGGQQEEK